MMLPPDLKIKLQHVHDELAMARPDLAASVSDVLDAAETPPAGKPHEFRTITGADWVRALRAARARRKEAREKRRY